MMTEVIEKDAKLMEGVEKLLERYKKLGLEFPAGYNPRNELSRALLKLIQTTRDKKPILEVCTKESIVNALLDMCIQGLNINQGYFIPYGDTLTFQRNYFGTVALMKRLTGAAEVVALCVYEGDEFEFEIKEGVPYITKHKSSLQNMMKEKIKAAYAIVKFADGRQYTEIMPLSQILAAWRMSKNNPFGIDGKLRKDSIHYIFFEEMAKRTVIQRACKIMLNSAVTDPSASLIVQKMNEEVNEIALEAETTEAIENMEVLELPEKETELPQEKLPLKEKEGKEEEIPF